MAQGQHIPPTPHYAAVDGHLTHRQTQITTEFNNYVTYVIHQRNSQERNQKVVKAIKSNIRTLGADNKITHGLASVVEPEPNFLAGAGAGEKAPPHLL